MPKNSLTTEQLLAAYWLDNTNPTDIKATIYERLLAFVKERQFKMPDSAIAKAAEHLESDFVNDDIEQWIVVLTFRGHPHAIWNFMLDAIMFAKTNDHLSRIAVGLAETLLAHYGSMIPHFERQAEHDRKFACMLTGMWRHRMSDDVWARLRALQSKVALPLAPDVYSATSDEQMFEHMRPEDRKNDDKGLYRRNAAGTWVKALN